MKAKYLYLLPLLLGILLAVSTLYSFLHLSAFHAAYSLPAKIYPQRPFIEVLWSPQSRQDDVANLQKLASAYSSPLLMDDSDIGPGEEQVHSYYFSPLSAETGDVGAFYALMDPQNLLLDNQKQALFLSSSPDTATERQLRLPQALGLEAVPPHDRYRLANLSQFTEDQRNFPAEWEAYVYFYPQEQQKEALLQALEKDPARFQLLATDRESYLASQHLDKRSLPEFSIATALLAFLMMLYIATATKRASLSPLFKKRWQSFFCYFLLFVLPCLASILVLQADRPVRLLYFRYAISALLWPCVALLASTLLTVFLEKRAPKTCSISCDILQSACLVLLILFSWVNFSALHSLYPRWEKSSPQQQTGAQMKISSYKVADKNRRTYVSLLQKMSATFFEPQAKGEVYGDRFSTVTPPNQDAYLIVNKTYLSNPLLSPFSLPSPPSGNNLLLLPPGQTPPESLQNIPRLQTITLTEAVDWPAPDKAYLFGGGWPLLILQEEEICQLAPYPFTFYLPHTEQTESNLKQALSEQHLADSVQLEIVSSPEHLRFIHRSTAQTMLIYGLFVLIAFALFCLLSVGRKPRLSVLLPLLPLLLFKTGIGAALEKFRPWIVSGEMKGEDLLLAMLAPLLLFIILYVKHRAWRKIEDKT